MKNKYICICEIVNFRKLQKLKCTKKIEQFWQKFLKRIAEKNLSAEKKNHKNIALLLKYAPSSSRQRQNASKGQKKKYKKKNETKHADNL